MISTGIDGEDEGFSHRLSNREFTGIRSDRQGGSCSENGWDWEGACLNGVLGPPER